MVGFILDNYLDEQGVKQFLTADILLVGPLKIPEDVHTEFLFVATPLKLKNGNVRQFGLWGIVESQNKTL
jgi:hypothetical protein